ncbi:hypothetical protein [Lysinibacillus sp. KU-BSD001]|uniref:hypothetical protein n=1 Tax=Lysinibacillus sp. KU-BSD001 TaxID=3141328 RepID=UPI0036F2C44E
MKNGVLCTLEDLIEEEHQRLEEIENFYNIPELDFVFVFRLYECDAVAARSLDDAIKWYKELGDDILNYELLKNHLVFKGESAFLKRFILVIMSMLSAFITAIIIPNFNDSFKEYFNKIIEIFPVIFSSAGLSLIIIILIFVIYIFIKEVFEIFTAKTRSIKYIISMLDIIIEDYKK